MLDKKKKVFPVLLILFFGGVSNKILLKILVWSTEYYKSLCKMLKNDELERRKVYV